MTPDPPPPANGGTPIPPEKTSAPAPSVEVDYELIRLIGRGGYGEVWLVRDRSGDYHACKVVYRASFQQDRPYEREYEGICKFEPVSRGSESQIKILHVGRRTAADYFYYLMELADDVETGRQIHPDRYVPKTLKSELERRQKLPAGECIQIGLSLSAALDNLHSHGLIHRDIKPGNIIFVNGVPKLADIGLVTDLDVTVSYVGTEGYIPPEGPTSPRADVYGLGKVLYEISTGKDRLEYPELPVDFADQPDWEQSLELNTVIARACETEADRRYASVGELRADLALLAAGESVRRRRANRRRRVLAAQAGAVLAATAVITGGLVYFPKHQATVKPEAATKSAPATSPAPNAARLTECESQIKAAYYDQLIGGTAAVKQQAAAELINRSQNEADPAMALASLRVAAQLVMTAGDFTRAMEICDTMAGRFQMEVLPVKAGLLAQGATYAHTDRDKNDLADVCVATGFQAISDDDYASADKLAALAATAAQHTGNARLVRQTAFLAQETARGASAYEHVKPFAARLHENPGDPAASLALGKFLALVKNDWAAGLPLMARGDNEAFKTNANAELNGDLKEPAEQVALGNSWWDLSATVPDDEKIPCQQRARYWYLKGLANSKEPDRSRLRQNLSERLQTVPTQAAELHIVSRVGGTEFIDIYSDEVLWHSSRRGTIGNRINQVKLGDFGASDLQVIKNSEATRLMPEAVDFSTARLNPDRKGPHHGRAELAIFEDHVRVTLAHPRNGSVEMDVTVTFGPQP